MSRSLKGRTAGFLVTLLAVVSLTVQGASAAMYRYMLANQSDWDAKKGFILDLEAEGPDGDLIDLSKAKLIMAVGDGRAWRYTDTTPGWKLDTAYSVRVLVENGRMELWLNGVMVDTASARLVPHDGPGEFGGVPDWASSPADFVTSQTSLDILSGGGAVLSSKRAPEPGGPLALFGRVGLMSRMEPLHLKAGASLEIRTVFGFGSLPRAVDVAPLVDRYGQPVHADWPDKVRTDADLKASVVKENAVLKEWGVPAGRDPYGGTKDLGWSVKGSGYYRLAKRNGMWWLITPEGYPCFYTGVCTAPSPTYPKTPVTGREYLFKELPPMDTPMVWGRDQWGEGDGTLYAGFIPWNLQRKYGKAWERESVAVTGRRIKAWGFSGVGKWGGMEGLPSVPVLGRWDVPNLVRHPDIFDNGVKDLFRMSLAQQIIPRKLDPLVVGWSLGNEYDEIISSEEVKAILAMEGTNPSKEAMLDHAVAKLYRGSLEALASAWGRKGATGKALAASPLKPPAKDLAQLRRFYADAYYAFVYSTVKSLDGNHLYFGFWIVPGWWEEEEDWDIAARHCDAIGYDRYAPTLMDEAMTKRVERTNKPVLLGEFSFPPTYGGARGFGANGSAFTESEETAAEKYRELIADAARNPMVVGTLWFEYRDQPITGRGAGQGDLVVYGEHYAFGLVDVADRPKWTLVGAMREVNLQAPYNRAKARP